MLKKNILGASIICIIVFSFVGYGLFIGITINWQAYLKILAIVAVIALCISLIVNIIPAGKK